MSPVDSDNRLSRPRTNERDARNIPRHRGKFPSAGGESRQEPSKRRVIAATVACDFLLSRTVKNRLTGNLSGPRTTRHVSWRERVTALSYGAEVRPGQSLIFFMAVESPADI